MAGEEIRLKPTWAKVSQDNRFANTDGGKQIKPSPHNMGSVAQTQKCNSDEFREKSVVMQLLTDVQYDQCEPDPKPRTNRDQHRRSSRERSRDGTVR